MARFKADLEARRPAPIITRENFHDELLAFAKRQPHLGDHKDRDKQTIEGHVMIFPESLAYQSPEARKRAENAKQAWFAYLSHKGLTKTLECWERHLRLGKKVMTPCESPVEFDPGYG